MARKYKFHDNSKLYFVTFTVVNWIDAFIREENRNIFYESVKYCQENKGLEVYGYCIMTSHISRRCWCFFPPTTSASANRGEELNYQKRSLKYKSTTFFDR
jgi:hypothetical protein